MVSPILAPAAALVAWSLVMLLWMAATRFHAMAKLGISLTPMVGNRGGELDGVVPPSVSWKAHNYAHLMEQPTIFYPTVLILAVAGADTALNVQLAWAYVALRVVHSLVQATWNRVVVRFSLFFASTVVLVALTVSALRATLG